MNSNVLAQGFRRFARNYLLRQCNFDRHTNRLMDATSLFATIPRQVTDFYSLLLFLYINNEIKLKKKHTHTYTYTHTLTYICKHTHTHTHTHTIFLLRNYNLFANFNKKRVFCTKKKNENKKTKNILRNVKVFLYTLFSTYILLHTVTLTLRTAQ